MGVAPRPEPFDRPMASGPAAYAAEGVTVLLVDEAESWRTRAAAALYRKGYDVLSVPDRWRIPELLDEAAPALVLLSTETPLEDAGVAKLLAQWRPRPKLILLCLPFAPEEQAAGLADACIAKPDDPDQLGALLDEILPALLREAPVASDGVVEFDGWRLLLGARRLVAPSGARVVLTPSDFLLLSAFLAHPGRVLNRAQLHRFCRIGEGVGEGVLECRVTRLRTTLKALDPRGPRLIRTVRGEGYVFVAGRDRRKLL
jgi:two-component system OmpR family response regulator